MPRPVHAKPVTRIVTTSPPSADAGTETSSTSEPTTNANAETTAPLTAIGAARPRKSASRLAGDTTSSESVCVISLVGDRVGHAEEARDGGRDDGVSG